MRRAGLTVAELSALAGLEPSLVAALIYGTAEGRASETLRLAGALGVGPDEFVNATEKSVGVVAGAAVATEPEVEVRR